MENDLQRDLGRVEGKLDTLIMQLTEHIKKDEVSWERVTRLEKKIMYAAGAVSVVVFFVTSAFTGVLKKIGLV